MKASAFDEEVFFRAVWESGARALLIGRQALVVLGIPLVTRDYDFWLHIDDMQTFNDAVEPFDLFPSRAPEEARRFGRYVLENDERMDVLIARSVPTVDGVTVRFEDVWERRVTDWLDEQTRLLRPCIDDLILTKRFGGRPKDAEDIRQLEVLRARGRT